MFPICYVWSLHRRGEGRVTEREVEVETDRKCQDLKKKKMDGHGGGRRRRASQQREENLRERVKGVRERGGEGRSWRLLTEVERKTGGEVEGSCRWTVWTSKQRVQQRCRG